MSEVLGGFVGFWGVLFFSFCNFVFGIFGEGLAGGLGGCGAGGLVGWRAGGLVGWEFWGVLEFGGFCFLFLLKFGEVLSGRFGLFGGCWGA